MHSTGVDPDMVSPGVPGFLVVFALALVTWLLIRSMTGHLRKVHYRAAAEAASAEAAEAAPSDPGPDGPAAVPPGREPR